MSTTIKISETYDMKTTIGKLGLIGVHTPSSAQIRQVYPGLVKNHRFIRIDACDVTGACASVLPADPLQVGVTAGSVAPEDMFNPILYKPVSNESFDNIVSRIYDGADVGALGSVNSSSISDTYAFDAYYALLAEHGRWIHSMPQNGFGLRGLYPICHELISTYGNQHKLNEKIDVLLADSTSTQNIADTDGVNIANQTLSAVTKKDVAITFKGRSLRMPRIPLHLSLEDTNGQAQEFIIPKTFVMAIVLPPAKLNEFYYRMRVTWTLTFEEVCPTTEYATASGLHSVANYSRSQGYTYPSSKSLVGSDVELDKSVDTVDASGVELNKIM